MAVVRPTPQNFNFRNAARSIENLRKAGRVKASERLQRRYDSFLGQLDDSTPDDKTGVADPSPTTTTATTPTQTTTGATTTTTTTNTNANTGTPLYVPEHGRNIDQDIAAKTRYLNTIKRRVQQWKNDPNRKNGVAAYQKQIAEIEGKLAKANAEKQRLAGLQNTTTQDPTTPAAPAEDPTFKSIEDFLAKNPAEDPMFQQEMRLGEDRVKKYMAARGLGGGGAEVTAMQNLANQAASNQVQRGLETAGLNAQMFQKYVQDLTQNKMQLSNDAWQKKMDGLRLMLEQSPMADAFRAALGTSNSLDGEGNNIGNALAGLFFNQPTGGGGGGGSNGYIPPFSTTGIDAGSAGSNNAGNMSLANLIAQLLGGLGGGSKQQ